MNTNNTVKNFNTNIDDYSVEELLSLLEIDNTDPTPEEITQKIDLINENNFNNNSITAFFYAVQNKLLNEYNNISDYLREDILPTSLNIETMENINPIEDNNQSEDNQETIDNNQIEIEDSQDLTQNPDPNSTQTYNTYDLIPIDHNITENYDMYNYLHFNTLFRTKIYNATTKTFEPSTNSNFILSTPINNITQIKLASINIKKPYLISESKLNNTFIIKKYVKISESASPICDFSKSIIIEDGYYDNPTSLENYLNNNFFVTSDSQEDFLKQLTFSIDENSKKIKFKFDLSNNYTSDASFNYFSIDFKTNYTSYYSLATILGFEYNKLENYYNSISETSNNNINNTTLTSPYVFSNKGTTELFFCFDEYQSNIIETHKLFLNNNMSTNKILAKINASIGTKNSDYYINETFSTNDDRKDIIRKYDGAINLLNFNIKIIDYYGNIINTNINEDYTFTLEVKINQTRLINQL